jgi:hypothetical protein
LQERIFEDAGWVAAIAADENARAQMRMSVATAARGRSESIALRKPPCIAAPLDPIG